MSDIDKIRQEIERLRRESGPEHFDFYELLDHFKDFIDSLPEEGLYVEVGDTEEDYIKRSMVKVNECRKMICKDSLQVQESCKENTNSFTNDLEEAAEKYAYRGIPDEMKSYVKPVGDEVIKNFIAGAKWMESQMPMPEDTVIFMKGVEEGRRLEKNDLALTWEDMAKIDAIILVVHNKFAVDDIKEIDAQKFYEEVLTRFKETKK